MQKNRQMTAMLLPAQERLKKYEIQNICQRAGVQFDTESQEFFFESMGQEIRVAYPTFEIRQEIEMWHYLTLLQYLNTADGRDLQGQWISLVDMRGGISRGQGFNREIEEIFTQFFGKITKEEFRQACLSLGGELLEDKADVCAVISYAPRFPIRVSFWQADEEFCASGKTLVDANAEHYLSLEAAGAACVYTVQKIRAYFLNKTLS